MSLRRDGNNGPRGSGGGRPTALSPPSTDSSPRRSGGPKLKAGPPPKLKPPPTSSPSSQSQSVSSSRNDLEELEFRLQSEVDDDFFQDPAKFHTTHRVIDVLGAQLLDDTDSNDPETLRKNNPAYKALKKQQQVVEEAIEHVAIAHCADLNASVVHVGRVSRHFTEAVGKVQSLRRQVQDIQETLGTSSTTTHEMNTTSSSNLNDSAMTTTSEAQAVAMSLRELWLKKLECEAVLSLLEKMDVVRAAPAEFDAYIRPRSGGPCRIGAAVLTLSHAFDIAFNSNVTYVPALQNISQEITNRKQVADQIIWETLVEVLYLRTANGQVSVEMPTSSSGVSTTAASVEQQQQQQQGTNQITSKTGIKNPFLHRNMKVFHQDNDDWDSQSFDSDTTASTQFSKESGTSSSKLTATNTRPESAGSGGGEGRKVTTRMLIPTTLLETELDLETDELRCLEQQVAMTPSLSSKQWDVVIAQRTLLPRYEDHVLALRILVDCLAKLNRLDDVERTLHESLRDEIRKIAAREQARTFMRLERGARKSKRGTRDLKDFRKHFQGVLTSFGCVMIRLSHLAQIFRRVIVSDKGLVLPSYPVPTCAMHSVLVAAYDMMQREIKDFLRACLFETEKSSDDTNDTNAGISSHERGFFSLGIASDSIKKDSGYGSLAASRARNMELPAGKFVVNVLFPKTNTSANVRFALEFRKALARWTLDNESLKQELALVTGEDTSTPSYNQKLEETALEFLDGVIKRQLIPILQDDALKGTTSALEREDAFDPVIDRNLYGKNSNEPQDVDMCIACQALYYSTGYIFQALHRLPQDEKMYLHLVGVLEHAILTFTSRVTPRVQQICHDKMALRLLLDPGKNGKENSFSSVIERRRAFSQLLRAYADGDLLEVTKPVEDGDLSIKDAVMPLSPPSADTMPRNATEKAAASSDLDLGGSIEREEQNLLDELVHLQPLLEFTKDSHALGIVVCSDEELMKASCLAHSLLKLASLLESRLKVRNTSGFETILPSTRALREAVKSIRNQGLKMAKFCRTDMLLQSLTRLSKICRSSTIVAKDAVRIPSCVNDLGEYLTFASDNLREAGGNALTAYTFSSLEQYIPLFLMQTVRVIASGGGVVAKSALTLNGVESLDRSGSVLYRDLKGATGFDNSFWDDELAAISFERSASFMAMMELEMEELEAYYRANHDDFAENDFQLMFAMNGPRRRGDIGRYNMMKRKLFP